MKDKFYHFNLERAIAWSHKMTDEAIEKLSKKADRTEKDMWKMLWLKTKKAELNKMSDGMEIKNLPFYQDYLRKFDVDSLLGNYVLKTSPDLEATQADFDLLMRLVAGSRTISYDLAHDKDGKQVILSITVLGKEIKPKRLDELFSPQIEMVFNIFFNEQVELVSWYKISEVTRTVVVDLREKKLKEFEDKIKQLTDYKESLEIINNLDQLLNS